MKKVWSVTINGKNDCVVMTDEEAMIITLKFSPDIEDVRAVSTDVLRHRLVKNYKAEAEGISIEKIIQNLF